MATWAERRARRAANRYRRTWPDAVLIGHGPKRSGGRVTGDVAVIVGVRKKKPLSLVAKPIPTTVHPAWWSLRSVKTDVIEVGEISALRPIPQAITDRQKAWRPPPGGVSIGHKDITAGTLGVIVMNALDELLILSNNHVLANSGKATVGDSILQPGPYDSGTPENEVARLTAFVPITFDGQAPIPDKCKVSALVVRALNAITWSIRSQTIYLAVDAAAPNLVDAAVAKPTTLVDPRVLDNVEKPTVTVRGTKSLETGSRVFKSGRTTGYTTGEVAAIGVSVQVGYGEDGTATFEDQVLINKPGFSAGGDSGSAIITEDGFVGGLLFAGSDQVTIANRIEHVMEALGVKV